MSENQHYALYFLTCDQCYLHSLLREHPICYSVLLQDTIFLVAIHVESIVGGVSTLFGHIPVRALHDPPRDL